MKNDKVVEKALTKIAELMLLEENVSSVLKALEHCHPIGKRN